jgi:TrmH family RNA methyltransferase
MTDESKQFRNLASRVSVVLVGALYPGNVGAVARSMRNFGFSDLRLAESSVRFDDIDAIKMAMWSKEILDSARAFDTAAEAVQDADIVIGTTRRRGRRRARWFSPAQMAQALKDSDSDVRAAVLFGAEDSGLTNSHLDLCHWLVSIPTRADFDSFNIAHAATIVLYEISRAFEAAGSRDLCDPSHAAGLASHVEQLLRDSGFLPGANDPKRVMLAVRRMLDNAGWTRAEIDLSHSIITHIQKRIESGNAEKAVLSGEADPDISPVK